MGKGSDKPTPRKRKTVAEKIVDKIEEKTEGNKSLSVEDAAHLLMDAFIPSVAVKGSATYQTPKGTFSADFTADSPVTALAGVIARQVEVERNPYFYVADGVMTWIGSVKDLTRIIALNLDRVNDRFYKHKNRERIQFLTLARELCEHIRFTKNKTTAETLRVQLSKSADDTEEELDFDAEQYEEVEEALIAYLTEAKIFDPD